MRFGVAKVIRNFAFFLVCACQNENDRAANIANTTIDVWVLQGFQAPSCNVNLRDFKIEQISQHSIDKWCADTDTEGCMILKRDFKSLFQWYPVAYLSPKIEGEMVDRAAVHLFIHFLARCTDIGEDQEHMLPLLWTQSRWAVSVEPNANSVETIVLEELLGS